MVREREVLGEVLDGVGGIEEREFWLLYEGLGDEVVGCVGIEFV